MKKSIQLFLLLLVIQAFTNAQTIPGSVMVVGGGSESNGGWSDEPYTWAVSQAENGRVAIVGASNDPSDWLPNYFMNTCGAVFAKNFTIANFNTADSQETYDSLVTYDMIFLEEEINMIIILIIKTPKLMMLLWKFLIMEVLFVGHRLVFTFYLK